MSGKTVKQTAKKRHLQAVVTCLVLSCDHAKSHDRFEILMISKNHYVGDLPTKMNLMQAVEFKTAQPRSLDAWYQ